MKGRTRRLAASVLIVAVVAALIFRGPLLTGGRALLFIAQVFPQVPVKPLDWISRAPRFRTVTLSGTSEPIVARLWIPRPLFGSVAAKSHAAIIIAQGVRVPHGALADFDRLAGALARLGYVVLFPQSLALARGQVGLEPPSTFVEAFDYVETLRAVDPHRVSFLGISVGSSVALVACANPSIRRKVHALIFFAGYYDVFDYLAAVATSRDEFQGRAVTWSPSTGAAGAVDQTRAILVHAGVPQAAVLFALHSPTVAKAILEQAPAPVLTQLRDYDPAAVVHDFRAPTFILDDYDDRFVPYVESEKLARVLPHGQVKAFLLSSAFQHVSPGPGGLPRLLGGFGGVFEFLYQVLSFL